MTCQTPMAKDDPRLVAWESFKQTEEFANARRWAAHDEHLDGSLWALFLAGWQAREPAACETKRCPTCDGRRVHPDDIAEFDRIIRQGPQATILGPPYRGFKPCPTCSGEPAAEQRETLDRAHDTIQAIIEVLGINPIADNAVVVEAVRALVASPTSERGGEEAVVRWIEERAKDAVPNYEDDHDRTLITDFADSLAADAGDLLAAYRAARGQ